MSGAADLGGHWDGIFNYPHTLPPTGFVVALRDHGGHLLGETSEPAADGTTLHALIEGQRTGSDVTFVKTYDEPGSTRRSPVHYVGTLNADATEIAGRWRIPGNWGGTFLMVRQPPGGAEVSEEIEEVIVD